MAFCKSNAWSVAATVRVALVLSAAVGTVSVGAICGGDAALAQVVRDDKSAGLRSAGSGLVVSPAAPGAAIAAERPINDKWALVVGVGKFKDAKIAPQPWAEKNARAFADFLVDKEHFAKNHVEVLLNEGASHDRLMEQLGGGLLSEAGKDDLVVFYYAGYCSPPSEDMMGSTYLASCDADSSKWFATGLAADRLPALLGDRVRADRCLIVLDSAHCGAVFGTEEPDVESPSRRLLRSGQWLIASSSTNDNDCQTEKYKGSVFLHFFMEGLRRDGDQTKLSEAFGYAKKATSEAVKGETGKSQTAVMASGGGDLEPGLSAKKFSAR